LLDALASNIFSEKALALIGTVLKSLACRVAVTTISSSPD